MNHHSTNPTIQHLGDHLNPRRRRQAKRMLDYVLYHCSKVYIEDRTYREIRDEWMTRGMERYQIDQAIDDLYSLGVVDMTVNGDRVTVTALADSIDANIATPSPAPAPRPTTQPKAPVTRATFKLERSAI